MGKGALISNAPRSLKFESAVRNELTTESTELTCNMIAEFKLGIRDGPANSSGVEKAKASKSKMTI